MVKKVCPKEKKLTKTGNRCVKDNQSKQRQTVCNEGYKMTKNGKCIKDKKITIKAYGQRQTVCYEGYKMTKNGKCIKDKQYKTIVVPVETPITGDLISFEEVAKVPSVKKSVSRTASYKNYMDSRMDEF